MIPKVIHYCWFGRGPKSELSERCIASWKKLFPEYEIKEWNEDNFDVNIIPYTAEAYRNKKYAFVSDYARFWILYNYGGIYFDTDVEVIKDMSPILARGPYLGCELTYKDGNYIPHVATGLGMAAVAGMEFYKKILDIYHEKYYISPKGYITGTVVQIITRLIKNEAPELNLNDICSFRGITIYPAEYFCPKNYNTGELTITDNTYTIHHYIASWADDKNGKKKVSARKKQLKNMFNHYCFLVSYFFTGKCKKSKK